jgi:hypothetical protein
MFKDLDGAEISYEAAPTRTFSGLKKYPSMTTFKRKLQKMSEKLDTAQQRTDLDDSGQQTEKNYFSKHAVPYLNRGSRGSRPRLETAQPLTTGAQQGTPQLTSPKQESSQTFSKYQRPDKTTVTWYSNKQSPREALEHMKAEGQELLDETDELEDIESPTGQEGKTESKPVSKKVRIVDLRRNRNVVPGYHTERVMELKQMKVDSQLRVKKMQPEQQAS